MVLILNEVEQVKNILLSGEIGSKPSSTLFLIAKYYRQHLEYSQKETVKELNKFMTNHYPNYNSVLWENIIENISKNANKYPLRMIEKIGITKNELDYIRLLNNINYEKLVFSMLCYAKTHNLSNEKNNGWVNCKIPELFRTSRINVKYKDDKMFMLNNIKNILLLDSVDEDGVIIKLPLISFSKKNDNKNIKLNFIDDSDDYILYISDFRELGYEYLLYLGENYTRCETCGALFKQNKTNTYKYCIKHRGYQKQGVKTITCIEPDCGKEVEVDALDNQTTRCEGCYEIYRKKYKAIKEKERRDRLKQ